MSVNISEEDIGMVDAAKDLGRSARQIEQLIGESKDGDASAAVEAAETMFQSNIQCLSHILTLRKQSEEMESNHHEMIEELKDDFASELMRKEFKIEEKDKTIDELEKTMDELRNELKELKMGQALQGVWASLLKPDSFPLPEVIQDKNGHQRLSLDGNSTQDREASDRPDVNAKSHIASALRMVSTQIAKEVISQAAVNEDGDRIKNRQDGFMQKLLEAAWFIEGRVDGELASKAEQICKLEDYVAQTRSDKELALLQATKREETLSRLLEHRDIELEDLRAQLLRALTMTVDGGNSSSSATLGATPFKCASPSAFCSPYSESEANLSPHKMQTRVHFSAPVSEIKREIDVSKAGMSHILPGRGKENSPHSANRSRGAKSPSSTRKSPSAMSTFKSPSYDHPYHPRLYTGSYNCAVVSPSPSKLAASPATEGGIPSSRAPSSTCSLERSACSHHALRLNGSINPHAKDRPTAKVHVSKGGDPYRRENDHAVNRPNRAFIVTSKSPIDTNQSDVFLHSSSSKNMRDQMEADHAGMSSEELKRLRNKANSVSIVMNYGTTMKSLEAPTTAVYSNQVTPPKAVTDSGPFKSMWLNMRRTGTASHSIR